MFLLKQFFPSCFILPRCPWLSEYFSSVIPIYNAVIFLFTLANFCMATFMDPGVFPRGEHTTYVIVQVCPIKCIFHVLMIHIQFSERLIYKITPKRISNNNDNDPLEIILLNWTQGRCVILYYDVSATCIFALRSGGG